MNENELRRIAKSLRGACPETEALVRYVEQALPAAEVDSLAQHLLLCGSCAHDEAVLRQSLDPGLPDAGKEGAREERIQARFRLFLQQHKQTTSRAGFPRFPAAAAAAIILLLLYPAYLGLRQMLPRVVPAAPAAHIARLDSALRNATPQVPVIRPDKNAFYLGLMFFVPIPEARLPESPLAKLDCRLQRGSRVVYATGNIGSFDGIGNFLLMIPLSSLEAGPDYVLTVAQTGNPAREWQFLFALETRPP